jgi:8-oxo-dGTP pyrophosphatase MutT (NUDIX family)
MLLGVISVDRVRSALARHEPEVLPVEEVRHAAVAMVLTEGGSGAEVLFIERARHEGDPWSGHMACPGGRVDPGDAGGREAAERETLEEVGLHLEHAELLGRLDDKKGNPRTQSELVISAFVYHLPAPSALRPNYEVEEAFWFPLAGLLEDANHVHYTAREEFEFPGILVGEPDRHIVWGLTYSFLESFFEVIEAPLPDRWSEGLRAYSRGMAERG